MGIANDAAQFLHYHRERRGQATYAEPLLWCLQHIATVADLDRGYELLRRAGLIERAEGEVLLGEEPGGGVVRPKYVRR